MWNEIIACYWEYKVIRHVNRYVQENKGEKKLVRNFYFSKEKQFIGKLFFNFFFIINLVILHV